MFRSKMLKSKASTSAALTSRAGPSQVQKTQNRPVSPEKENLIQSSQESNSTQNKTQNATRNRFLSQRQALLNATQQQQNKGKGPLEVILYSCGMEISEIGKILKYYEMLAFFNPSGSF